VAFVFLSLFHLLGGGGLGVALRPLRTRPAGSRGCGVNVGLAIWGLMFGGIPLLMALEAPWLLPVQLCEMLVAFFITFFFWDRIRELLSHDNVLLVLIGGVFFMAGSGVASILLKDGDFLLSAVIGLLFGGLGLALVLLGLRRIFKLLSDAGDE